MQHLEPAKQVLQRALGLCKILGLPMAADKTEGPATKLTFLGIELDTMEMRASLPADKLEELRDLLTEWSSKEKASIQELQSLAGMLNFACAVVRPGRFYLRRIIDWTAHLQKTIRWNKRPIDIGPTVRGDIAWWNEFLPQWNGTSLLYEEEWTNAEHIELFTDACLTGYGGRLGSEWFCGAWSPVMLDYAVVNTRVSMPLLELRALVMAAATWGARWAQKKIIFRCDCKPVVDAIRRCSSRRPKMMHLLRHLSTLAITHGFDFRCEHIDGVANVTADLLSRHGEQAIRMTEYLAVCGRSAPRGCIVPPIPIITAPPSSSVRDSKETGLMEEEEEPADS